MSKIFWVVVVVVGVVWLGAVGALPKVVGQVVPIESNLQKFQRLEKENLLQHLKDRLVDEESARFRDVEMFRHSFKGLGLEDTPSGNYALCGQVNAQNRMGGYTGYKAFIVSEFVMSTGIPSKSTLWVEFEPDSDFESWEHEKRRSYERFQERYKQDCENTIEEAKAK